MRVLCDQRIKNRVTTASQILSGCPWLLTRTKHVARHAKSPSERCRPCRMSIRRQVFSAISGYSAPAASDRQQLCDSDPPCWAESFRDTNPANVPQIHRLIALDSQVAEGCEPDYVASAWSFHAGIKRDHLAEIPSEQLDTRRLTFS